MKTQLAFGALCCVAIWGLYLLSATNSTNNSGSSTATTTSLALPGGGVEFVLYNATIHTADPRRPRASALAVNAAGRLVAVGNSKRILQRYPNFRKIDAEGRTVLPGLIDAHAHLLAKGEQMAALDLTGCRSLREVLDRCIEYVLIRKLPAGSLLQGGGWDESLWGPGAKFPTRDDLDAVFPDRPVLLERVDGHSVWANSRAIELASPLPDQVAGGSILRNSSGIATGLFVDAACSLLYKNAGASEEAQVSSRDALLLAIREANMHGLTSVHDAATPLSVINLMKEMIDSDDSMEVFTLRIYTLVQGTDIAATKEFCPYQDVRSSHSSRHHSHHTSTAKPTPTHTAAPTPAPTPSASTPSSPVLSSPSSSVPSSHTTWIEPPQSQIFGYGSNRLTVRAVKLFMDGALGSRGAALLKPYSDDANNTGGLQHSASEIYSLVDHWAGCGFQVCTHAIGDKANRMVLDAYERVFSDDVLPSRRRFRIEHAQILSPDDLPRFAALGVLPSMQPTHCTSDMTFALQRLGPERMKTSYAWRSLLDTAPHVVIPMGSDFPFAGYANPFWGLHAAITRQDGNGDPRGGWFGEQRVTPLEALLGFTRWAAFAAFQENEVGSLESGKYADFVIVLGPVDILDESVSMDAERALLLRHARVLTTVLGGNPVYIAPTSPSAPSASPAVDDDPAPETLSPADERLIREFESIAGIRKHAHKKGK